MRYEGKLFWPGPVEAGGYLLQVTIGCSHNACTFCSFYKDKKFRVRPIEEIMEDIEMARQYYGHVPNVFIGDGNPLSLPMDDLRRIMKKINETFPESAHTNMYARFSDLAKKSVDELKELKGLGLQKVYTGLESGSDIVLRNIRKGYTAKKAIEGARHVCEAGIDFNSGAILGLGGVEYSDDHVNETIKVINEMQAPSIGIMALNPQIGTPLYQDAVDGKFELPTYRQILHEEREILTNLEIKKPTLLFSGGYLPRGDVIFCNLPEDWDYVQKQLDMREEIFKPILDEKIRLNGGL